MYVILRYNSQIHFQMTFGCFKTVSDGRIQSVGVELWETYRVLNDTRVKTQLVGDWVSVESNLIYDIQYYSSFRQPELGRL